MLISIEHLHTGSDNNNNGVCWVEQYVNSGKHTYTLVDYMSYAEYYIITPMHATTYHNYTYCSYICDCIFFVYSFLVQRNAELTFKRKHL